MIDLLSYAMGKAAGGGGGGGGGDITVEPLSVTENDTYTAPSGKAYSPVTVAVPNSYAASDEGKVVSNGALVAQTSDTVTANDTYDTTLINSLTVNVSGSGGYTVDQIASRSNIITGAITLNNSDNDIRRGAFSACKGITSVYAPNITGANNSGYAFVQSFMDCTGITNISFPNAVGFGQSTFEGCSGLTTVVLPKLYRFDSSVFNKCSNLATLDAGGSGSASIASYALSSSKLSTLVLRSTTMLSLGNTNAFNGSAFASSGSGGTLYVPASLVSSYTGATNWSTILGYTNNQIKSIESTHTDPTAPIDLTLYYADGTLIPTT